MKKYLNYTLTALALVALVACADEASSTSSGTTPTPEDGKTLIAFSQEGSAMTTRAITRAGFTSNTKVVMRIKAEGKTAVRYTQAVATAAAQTTTDDDCNTGYGLVGTHSHLTYAPGPGMNRYWDDAFGRDTKLTVYAVAVPNKSVEDNVIADNKLNQDGGTTVAPDWYTVATENTKISWSVSTDQTTTPLSVQDLVYSNNIRSAETVNKGCYRQTWNGSAWAKSMQLGRMIWQSKDPDDASVTVGQFDKGHLVFKHALSWITIVLTEGSGFDNTVNTDFVWTNKPAGSSQSFALKGFPTSGKLDLSNGEWSDVVTNVDITQLDDVSPATPANQTTHQLEAYVLPGTVLDDNANNFIEFEIDNAKYYVSGEQIAEAVKSYYSATPASPYASFTTTEAGKHYVINLTVSKKGIDNITASVVPWETVNADEITPSNARITVSLLDNGTKKTGNADFDLYRKASVSTSISDVFENYDWSTGYVPSATPNINKAILVENTTNSGIYTAKESTVDSNPEWYWPDNKTYYHFRAVMPKDHLVTSAENDYFTLTGATNYTDVCWGAPFSAQDASHLTTPLNGSKLTYNLESGFDNTATTTHQITKAIGPTTDPINMLMFHMMSDVTIQLTTTNDADAVDLASAKVQLTYIHPTGKVSMGNGLVTPDGTPAPVEGTVDGDYKWHYGFVPQSLENVSAENDVILTITTADNNRYIVDMKNVEFSTTAFSNTLIANPYSETSSGSGKYKINRWYPNFKYTYTFNLKKTGVALITATLANWESVTATSQTVVIQ